MKRIVGRRHLPALAVLPLVLFLLTFVLSLEARASVAVLLEMPYGKLGAFNPTGHAALYFDHVCAATPLELRPCRPGEVGVVISRYDGISDVDWVAVPLIPYLYGVEKAEDIPTKMDKLDALRIRDLYRREHLAAVAPDDAAGGMPPGNWYQLAGSAFDRSLYGFQLKTTREQDEAVIAFFNDRPNVTRYQGAFRNCADFTRIVINRLFPHAVRRNYIADFGLTTPKSVARGVVHYGRKHPNLELTMFRVPQMPGSIPRSMGIEGVTGSLLSRYGVPMAVLAPHVTAVVLVAYIGKGRFAVPKQAPVLNLAQLEQDLRDTYPPSPALSLADARDAENAPENGSSTESGDFGAFGGSLLYTGYQRNPACDLCDAVPFLP